MKYEQMVWYVWHCGWDWPHDYEYDCIVYLYEKKTHWNRIGFGDSHEHIIDVVALSSYSYSCSGSGSYRNEFLWFACMGNFIHPEIVSVWHESSVLPQQIKNKLLNGFFGSRILMLRTFFVLSVKLEKLKPKWFSLSQSRRKERFFLFFFKFREVGWMRENRWYCFELQIPLNSSR